MKLKELLELDHSTLRSYMRKRGEQGYPSDHDSKEKRKDFMNRAWQRVNHQDPLRHQKAANRRRMQDIEDEKNPPSKSSTNYSNHKDIDYGYGKGRYMGDSELETKSITMSLFLRLLEWAKEDAKDDVALHVAAENLFSLEAESLDIDSYEKIIQAELDESKKTPLHLLPTIGYNSKKFDSKYQFDAELSALYGKPKKISDMGRTYFISKDGKNVLATFIDGKGIVYSK